jgi:hypothetical protein
MKLIVCEGKDDKEVIERLLVFEKLSGIAVEQCEGVDNLSRYLGDLPKRPEFTRKEVESLGIVIDADSSKAAAWQKVTTIVRKSFGIILAEPGIFEGSGLRIGGLVMGVGDAGNLENVCLGAMAGSPGYSCLDAYFQCLSTKTGASAYSSKAKFRAWMASKSDHEYYIGKAAGAGYLPWENAAFGPLRQFLKSM